MTPPVHTVRPKAEASTVSRETPACAHCGDPCEPRPVRRDGAVFCCSGCATAYALIHELGLEDYYALNEAPGAPVKQDNDWSWMDEPALQDRLVRFRQAGRAVVVFRLPSIHCSSCVWLLERMPQYVDGVIEARVHYGRRELELHFDPDAVRLSAVATQLQRLGYAPSVNRADLDGDPDAERRSRVRDPLLMRLGVAGFCAGNIMLLSFPDYFHWDAGSAGAMYGLVNALKVALALPVLFYSGSVYWRAAWLSLRARVPSVDIPIALGMLALAARSFWDIFSASGEGYLDSLAGLVFLLLVGRWFQDRVHGFLSFRRDYRSFFPASVLKETAAGRTPVLPDDLEPGDTVLIRPGEVVPADGDLLEPARVDYHFLTGESEPLELAAGQRLYGGGRILERPARLRVAKRLATSYLASLWERGALRERTGGEARSAGEDARPRLAQVTDRLSRWFTPLVILLAFGAAAAWWGAGPAVALEILTAVLIVACPCGLALAAPFALGHALRRLDRAGLHLRDTAAIERLAALDTLVFDKTGTLTAPGGGAPEWRPEGAAEWRPAEDALPDPELRAAVAAVAAGSAHPVARRMAALWGGDALPLARGLREEAGRGVEGRVPSPEGERAVRIGSEGFCGLGPSAEGGTAITIDGRPLGRFRLRPALRPGAAETLRALGAETRGAGPRYALELLSGDQPTERARLAPLFPDAASLRFGVSPHDKLARVEALRAEGRTVGMLGDGLNDAGALAAADAGLAVADDLSGYFPASDGVLEAGALGELPALLRYARAMRAAVWTAIGVSFAYNLVGLSFAVSGRLTPLVAAILMPISSLTVAFLGLALAAWRARGLRPYGRTATPASGSMTQRTTPVDLGSARPVTHAANLPTGKRPGVSGPYPPSP